MPPLARAVVAVTKTKRRRFLYCVWWTGEPCSDPFRPPDAWSGGARTEEEALAMAEERAGRTLTPIEGRWAGAWQRVRRGLPAFPERKVRVEGAKPKDLGAHDVLGVAHDATLAEIKAQFRVRALELHPDHGGDDAGFIALKRAYDSLVAKRRRRGEKA